MGPFVASEETVESGRGQGRHKKRDKKAARAAQPRKVRGRIALPAAKPTIEDVVVKVLGRRQMAFPYILAKIQKDKLVATKSKDFANVLRRTLAISKRIQRVSRGVYAGQ